MRNHSDFLAGVVVTTAWFASTDLVTLTDAVIVFGSILVIYFAVALVAYLIRRVKTK